jgi:hypothetical protein
MHTHTNTHQHMQVPYRGPVDKTMLDLLGGLRSVATVVSLVNGQISYGSMHIFKYIKYTNIYIYIYIYYVCM